VEPKEPETLQTSVPDDDMILLQVTRLGRRDENECGICLKQLVLSAWGVGSCETSFSHHIMVSLARHRERG